MQNPLPPNHDKNHPQITQITQIAISDFGFRNADSGFPFFGDRLILPQTTANLTGLLHYRKIRNSHSEIRNRNLCNPCNLWMFFSADERKRGHQIKPGDLDWCVVEFSYTKSTNL
jgi:hypothetical protein